MAHKETLEARKKNRPVKLDHYQKMVMKAYLRPETRSSISHHWDLLCGRSMRMFRAVRGVGQKKDIV